MPSPVRHSYLPAIFLMCQASLGFSAMALCVKLLSSRLPSLEIVFFRSLIGSFMILAFMLRRGASIMGTKKRGLMILRGLVGFIALTLHFVTIAHLPLGTAVMLNYTGPIFAAIFSVIFLKERPGLFLCSMILISFAGVYLLVGAQLHALNLMVFLGILSAVTVGIVYILISAIGKEESSLTIIFYFTAISTLGSAFFLPFGFLWPNPHDWLLLIGVGVGSFLGQVWLTQSLRSAPASLVSPFSYLTPLFSFIYGLIFFSETLTRLSLVGAFLIIASGSAITWLEAKKNHTPELPA